MDGFGRYDPHERGLLAEVRAEQALIDKGYTILEHNYRVSGAEIDLIAQKGNCVVFVEVKLRSSARGGTGREAVTPAKQKRICKGALYYLMKNALMHRQARFDVIEIQAGRVTHIENAFPYQGPAF